MKSNVLCMIIAMAAAAALAGCGEDDCTSLWDANNAVAVKVPYAYGVTVVKIAEDCPTFFTLHGDTALFITYTEGKAAMSLSGIGHLATLEGKICNADAAPYDISLSFTSASGTDPMKIFSFVGTISPKDDATGSPPRLSGMLSGTRMKLDGTETCHITERFEPTL